MKKLISILLALCLALALLPGTVWAYSPSDTVYPVIGGNIYFDPVTGTVTDCDTSVTEAVIPSEIGGVPVTSIGSYAFSYCNALTSVTIPDSVTEIGDYAFNKCQSLTSVNIPDSVTEIGRNAFNECQSLTSVNIPDGITAIEMWTFQYCASLTGVTIPDSVTSIGRGAFSFCSSLTGVTIPSGVTSIGMEAFYSCWGLTSVNIPDGVTTIEQYTFSNCSNLTSVTIPDSVTEIGDYAFNKCFSLTDVYYGGSESQWKQIDIGTEALTIGFNGVTPALLNDGNARLLKATIHYNSAAPDLPSTLAGIPVTVNGKAVAWTDAAPFIDANGRTMVPLRAVADAMGLEVNWDENTREASFTGGGKTIVFPVDSTTARTSDGGTVTMDTAAVIVNERTYAPIRYLAEYFGYTVNWDDWARAVVIT